MNHDDKWNGGRGLPNDAVARRTQFKGSQFKDIKADYESIEVIAYSYLELCLSEAQSAMKALEDWRRACVVRKAEGTEEARIEAKADYSMVDSLVRKLLQINESTGRRDSGMNNSLHDDNKPLCAWETVLHSYAHVANLH